jgi:hypothetical protein
MLVHYLVFFAIIRVLLATFFVGPMPQEIDLTPVHLVRDASNFLLFAIISCKIDCQASRIHQHISVSVALLRRPVIVVSCVFCAHWLYERRICALNGRLIMTLSGCNIPVMPPGMITRSHFCHRNWAFIFSVVWSQKISKTSTDCWRDSAPGRRNYTDLVQSSTRSSVIQPLSWTRTIIP